jgi:hypothetical protein
VFRLHCVHILTILKSQNDRSTRLAKSGRGSGYLATAVFSGLDSN